MFIKNISGSDRKGVEFVFPRFKTRAQAVRRTSRLQEKLRPPSVIAAHSFESRNRVEETPAATKLGDRLCHLPKALINDSPRLINRVISPPPGAQEARDAARAERNRKSPIIARLLNPNEG